MEEIYRIHATTYNAATKALRRQIPGRVTKQLFVLMPPRRLLAGTYIEVDRTTLIQNIGQLQAMTEAGRIVVKTRDGRVLNLNTLEPIPLPGTPDPVHIDERHFPLDKTFYSTADKVEGKVDPAAPHTETTVEEVAPLAPITAEVNTVPLADVTPTEAVDASFANAFGGPAEEIVNSAEEVEVKAEIAAADMDDMSEAELEALTAPKAPPPAIVLGRDNKKRRGKLWRLRAYLEQLPRSERS